jgi:bifunctional N-acetylglucosamine-1-phosphate-uridyltransferase/glucosamine-1-phosphate-acetyltransferase GlmU-like protein
MLNTEPKKTTVTIMAAGEGKRMNSSIPKVLHLFKGVPMLIRIILEVIKLNIHKIVIVTGKYDQLIKDTIHIFFATNKIDKIDTINIIYVQQTTPIGTADAIKYTLDHYNDNEHVLILNGDMPLISSVLLEKFLEFQKHENKIMVAQLDNPYGYGRILYDIQCNFTGIKEEKDCSSDEKNINIINVGIYFFHSSTLQTFIPCIDNNNKQNEYYLTDIIKIIKNHNEKNTIYTYCIEEQLKYQIMGVNTQEELKKLEDSTE